METRTRKAGKVYAYRHGGRTVQVRLIGPKPAGGWIARNYFTDRIITIRPGRRLYPWSDPKWAKLIDTLTGDAIRLSVWWDPGCRSWEVTYPHKWTRHVRPCEVPSPRTAKNVAIAAYEKGGNDGK